MAITQIPALPPAPARGMAPDEFIPVSDTWVGAQPAFRTALNQFANEANALGVQMEVSRAVAEAKALEATNAAASAAASAASATAAPSTASTSTTSLAVTNGPKTLVVQPGKALAPGQFVTIARTAVVSTFMLAQVVSYNNSTGDLSVDVVAFEGAGTYSEWTVAVSAPMPKPSEAALAFSIIALIS